jgi:hypothetical protein
MTTETAFTVIAVAVRLPHGMLSGPVKQCTPLWVMVVGTLVMTLVQIV